MNLCACGCGKQVQYRWANGHNPKTPRTLKTLDCPVCGRLFRQRKRDQRLCSKPCAGQVKTMPTGRDHPRYKGGFFYSQGRLMVNCRDGTQVAWYRIVMQNKLGRALEADEVVHHLNGDYTDDRPANLEVLRQSEHVDRHRGAINAARWPTEAQAIG